MVVLGINFGVVVWVQSGAIERRASKKPPLQSSGWVPLFNAVAPESSIRAASINVTAGIQRDGFDPVQLGGTGECAEDGLPAGCVAGGKLRGEVDCSRVCVERVFLSIGDKQNLVDEKEGYGEIATKGVL